MVFGEDFVVLVGLVFVFCVIMLMFVIGNLVYDVVGMMVIGILLLIIVILIGNEVWVLLIG